MQMRIAVITPNDELCPQYACRGLSHAHDEWNAVGSRNHKIGKSINIDRPRTGAESC